MSNYEKINWKDYPDKTTPKSAKNFNHMDNGIYQNSVDIGDTSKISGIGDGTLAGAIASQNETLANQSEQISELNNGLNTTKSNLTPKLIWSRPLSAYDGELIVFDEQYSYLDIVFYGATDQNKLYTTRIFSGDYILENMCDFLLRQRGITFNNGDNLIIGNGSSRPYNGTLNTNNTVCIPTEIYGYKIS